MNSSTEDVLEPEPVYALIFGSILVLGLPLNAVSLWILLRHHSLKSPNTIFLVNLAISDLLLIISLPTRVYYYATGTWPLSNMACLWATMLFRSNIRSSSMFITFISVDRLLAVVYPLRSRHLRTSSIAWKGAALVWLIVVMVNIPESVEFVRQSKKLNVSSCFKSANSKSALRSAVVYFQLALVVTMLAVNIACTVMVFWTLHRRVSDSARVHNKVKVMLIFAMNLVMFTICFLPVSVRVPTKRTSDVLPLVCLATLNCCLDPLLYYFSFDAFWKKKEDLDLTRGQ
ncbi:lysophosphatidic acid receptor 6-like [Brachyistius frenatus]|uniref:lysophosphatidic acid receptor 6-like n=1 Tax=Brachyistius frenatus TaxID=100188 RepID=UPI0037E8C370